MKFLKVKGKINVTDRDLRVHLSRDFILYYKWMIEHYYWFYVSEPLHGAHITVINEKIHNVNTSHLKQYHKMEVELNYIPDLIVGAKSKNFRNFYVRIYSDFLEGIKKAEGINDKSILHVTVANTKNVRKETWFPELISLQ